MISRSRFRGAIARKRSTTRTDTTQYIIFLAYDSPPKGVGQTGSLPGVPERPHRRSQGKLPVCPTLAPRFSCFQRIATPHEGSSENSGQWADSSGGGRDQNCPLLSAHCPLSFTPSR